jgi:PAS domain S-box-containing protein
VANHDFDLAVIHRGLLRWFDELTQQGIFTTDSELVVRTWNRWLETATGHAAASVVGRPLFEAFPELASRGFEPYYRGALAGEIKVLAYGFHGHVISPREPSARELRQSGRIAPLASGDAIVGTITVIDDVSERIASERELRSQFEASEQARALAEEAVRVKDEFLTTLSHEIRTPLNAVLGWTKILLSRAVDPAMLSRALEVIDRNAMAQVRLIDDMLDTARIMSGKLRLETQVVDLARVALAAIDVVAPTATARNVELHAELGDEPCSMMGDPDRLQQVVWNLLANAIKFTEPGGHVTIRIARDGGLLTLTVTDTGEGIAPAFLPQIFERFRQADPSSSRRHGGLGIGLSLVRQIVELHGGRIVARSVQGEGSTFTVTLPARPDIAEAGVSAAEHHPMTLANVRVLVVDPEEDGREMLAVALQQHGAVVTTVARADEAAAFIDAAGHEAPQVIVAEVPDEGDAGLSLIQALERRSQSTAGSIPAIAVTSHDHPRQGKQLLAAGFHTHLSKPLTPHALAGAVRNALPPV